MSPPGRRVALLAATAAAGVLVGLDLLRAELGPPVRPWQYACAFVLLGLLALAARLLGTGFRAAWPFLALGLLLMPAAVDHARDIVSDGVLYYSYLRSALFDRDLDLANDYEVLGSDYRGPNVLPVGAPLLWSPLVSVVHLGREAARLLGLPAPTGGEPAYRAAVCLASFLFGAGGLFLLLDLLRRTASGSAAFWTTVIIWLGSPLRFYLSVLPSLAHACEFFAAVVALRAWVALRERPEFAPAFRMGLACGLLFLVRSQDGLVLLLPGLFLATRAWGGSGGKAALRALLGLGAGFVLAALPQLVVWQMQFGVPFLVPHRKVHGEAFLQAAQPELVGALLSPRGGLFVTHPVLLLAAAGVLVLALRPRRHEWAFGSGPGPAFDRTYALCLLPVLMLAWWLNASVFNWYQVRRYTGLVPFLAPGLLLLLAPLLRGSALPVALLALVTWRYDDAVDARRHNQGDPVPVREALSTMADRAVAAGYALVEPIFPRVAVTLLGSYTGAPVLDGDVTYVDLAGASPLLELPRPARYLSEPASEEGRVARWVTERHARLFVPLSRGGAIILRLQARALETRETQVLSVEWNGAACGEQAMEAAWREYSFEVPASAVRLGTNELVLRFSRAPLYFRVRGEGPRGVRPAALSLLALNRVRPRLP